MPDSFTSRIINNLIDWLIAFTVASLLLWFFVTQPVFTSDPEKTNHIVDINDLKMHVQLLTSAYAPRTINYDNLNKTADYIYRQFSQVGLPEYQSISTLSKEYRNVSLQLGPDTQELYVLGVHYDAEDDSVDTGGNASGVATLIELARHLAENNEKLKIGVILIAYPLSMNQSENIVNTGSYFHANSLKKINKKVRLMVSLDGVGHINTNNHSLNHPYKFLDFLYPPKDDTLKLVGRLKDFKSIRELKKGFNSASSLSLYSHTLFESFNKTDSTDHVNYWNQGFPAVLISDSLSKRKILDLKTKNDPKDQLDYEKMAMLVNSLYQAVLGTKPSEFDRIRLAQSSRNRNVKSSM